MQQQETVAQAGKYRAIVLPPVAAARSTVFTIALGVKKHKFLDKATLHVKFLSIK